MEGNGLGLEGLGNGVDLVAWQRGEGNHRGKDIFGCN